MTPDYKRYPTDCPHCDAKRGYPCDPAKAATSLEDWDAMTQICQFPCSCRRPNDCCHDSNPNSCCPKGCVGCDQPAVEGLITHDVDGHPYLVCDKHYVYNEACKQRGKK